MNWFLQRIGNGKQKKRNSKRTMGSLLQVVSMILIAFMLVGVSVNTASAANGIKIYNYTTKKKTTYTDKQIKVTMNGKQISKDNNPGILVDGIALVSYKDIFANKTIGAECVYDKSKGTVTIKKASTTIVLTINSKVAKVNGKSVTMSVAPVKIKYYSNNITKILVPSRFVSENLGYSYVWNSAKSTVAITGKANEQKETSPSKNTTTNTNSSSNTNTNTNSNTNKNTNTNNDTTIGLQLSYDGGAKFTYTGAQAKVTIDGTSIDLGKMPSIIKDNITMVRAKKVFSDSPIKAEYKYDSKTKTITLTKGNSQLVLQVGSKVAYLNGKATNLDQAPMSVYNYSSKTSYIMVPGNNVANLLGYDYEWKNSIRTSVITTRKITDTGKNTDKSDNLAPELSDSDIDLTGLILFEAKANEAKIGKANGLHIIQQNGAEVTDNSIPYTVERYITADNSNIVNAETYKIESATPFPMVTSSTQGQVITINTNQKTEDLTFNFYGFNSYLVNDIKTWKETTSNGGNIEISVRPEGYTYDLSMSEDRRTLYVTVYTNVVNSVTIGSNDKGDFIHIESNSSIKPVISKMDNLLLIEVPNTVSGIDEQNVEISDGKFIGVFQSLMSSEKAQYIIQLEKDVDIQTHSENNQFIVYLQKKKEETGTIPEPTNPSVETPSASVPEVKDPSKYNIVIPRPEGMEVSQLSDFDDYFNNRIYIRIKGNYVDYLKSKNITNKTSTVKDISIYLESGNVTVIRITTTKLQGYLYGVDDKHIYLKIGNPRDIYSRIVVLDPGHGGAANGARYFNTDEKDINFKILYEIASKYFYSDPSKVKAYYTRTTDVDMTLSNRAAFASKVGADLFISLHMNAATVSGAKGTEVYYANNNNKPNSAGLTSKKMAEIFVKKLTQGLGTQNRGAKAETYTVIYKNTVPAVLIELGFISNTSDYAVITDPAKQEQAAKIIYDTVLEIFKDYPTGR